MNEQEKEKVHTWLEESPKRGDRLIIEGIEQDDFHERAEAFRQKALSRGITLGVVYHAPIKTGMIFVKGE